MVLFVLSVIPRFVFLNMFVINVVSLPMYVKETHFCVALSVCLSDVVLGCLWLGKTLFSIMVWMVLILSWYSCMCRWYVLSQLYRNLIAVYLFWAGWLEE